ncbi:T9SS type A sorting domain-containing protein [Dinghuibacter silviterrae]|uniref:Putative secreted protein (Por secretion system target) n=1 Tax=Dinghuibacter silviterrae TaxID=1539049 RepID=A0A4R8DY42_9BACT|nr:T9SS type A sorting domain-containing protein [Dinghuibacter silviterrae]TDX02131.1 putative secreted protein (Por secretion system target) [Dinghuibacter silviterrae]
MIRMLLSFVFFLTTLSAFASGETITAVNLPSATNPCGQDYFQLTSFTPPAGANFQKSMWYGSGVYQATSTDVTQAVRITCNANDGNWTFTVYCIVYYDNGTTAKSNTINVPLAAIAMNTITQNTPALLNCTSPVTFNTTFTSQLYVPTPADVSSYTWNVPSNWTVTSGNGAGGTTNPTATVTPDATTAGNVSVTTTLYCGYTFTSTVLAVSRPTQAPTFGSTPTAICNNSANTFTINAPCGATSYNWSLSGNAAATFQASGSQSLSTPATSVVVSAGTVGSGSTVTVSVASVYPNGATSSPVSVAITTGTKGPFLNNLVDGEKLTGPGPFSWTMRPLTAEPIIAYNWIVEPVATISGKTTNTVTFTTPHLNSNQTGDVYITPEYETACGGWVDGPQYYFVDQGSGAGGFGAQTAKVTLMAHSGMREVAIIADKQEGEASTSTIKTANVFNTAGQLMKKATFGGTNATEYLDIHDLPDGIYFVQIMTSKGSSTQKFVVIR